MLRESSSFHKSSSGRGAAFRTGVVFRSAALWVVAATLAVVPWILGGAIPHARFLLMAGAAIAGLLALIGCLLRREIPTSLPLTVFPLWGFCLIGLVQLMPVFEHPAREMRHAVQPGFVADLPVFQKLGESRSNHPRTVLPSETRQGLAQFLALALIALVISETAVTPRDTAVVMVSLALSGCAMTVLALSQQYGVVETVIGNHWKVSTTIPFGCFVNPNNAAGWLIVCLGAAFYLGGRSFRHNDQFGMQASQYWSTPVERVWGAWARFVGRIANLNKSQILSSTAIVLLMGGIAATLSRAGIIAAILGLIAFGVFRLRTGKWVAAFLGLTAVLLLSGLFLNLMDLDTLVISELNTLKDPVSDSTGRLLHWTDSLQSVRDFPWLGSGLSAYRCASMPYQRHYIGKWFQRADNQYVEVLVECGLMGLCLFVVAGFLFIGFAWRVPIARGGRATSETHVAECLSGAAAIGVVGMAGAAFFDFGISQCSVSAALVAMMALMERWSLTRTPQTSSGNPQSGFSSGFGKMVAALAWVLAITATVCLMPDILAAARVLDASVAVERLASKPDVDSLLETGDSLKDQLELALADRSDDVLGLRHRVILLELLWRRDLLAKFIVGRDLTPQQKNAIFHELDPGALAFRMVDFNTSDDLRQQVRAEIDLGLKKYPWSAACKSLLGRAIGLPSLGVMQIESDFLYEPTVSGASNIAYFRFSEPHIADGLFELGLLLLRVGRVEESRSCWTQSLEASDVFRPQMLAELVRNSYPEAELDWLMPKSYESCVKCGQALRANPTLQKKLFDRAEEIWVRQSPRITESLILVRAAHLAQCNRVDEALASLDGFLFTEPDSLAVRKAKADVLERAGRTDEAYDEWLRITAFYPDEPGAEDALGRLIKKVATPNR